MTDKEIALQLTLPVIREGVNANKQSAQMVMSYYEEIFTRLRN